MDFSALTDAERKVWEAFPTGAPPTPVGSAKASSFEPVAYTADMLLPLIDLGQEKSFEPLASNRWLTYALIAVGWILVTTVVAGVAHSVRRD